MLSYTHNAHRTSTIRFSSRLWNGRDQHKDINVFRLQTFAFFYLFGDVSRWCTLTAVYAAGQESHMIHDSLFDLCGQWFIFNFDFVLVWYFAFENERRRFCKKCSRRLSGIG